MKHIPTVEALRWTRGIVPILDETSVDKVASSSVLVIRHAETVAGAGVSS
jgi:hypothetical protein